MRAYLGRNNMLLSFLATVVVFLFTSSYSPSARAAVTETYQPNQSAPVVVAWYGGRGGWYRGGYDRYRGYGYRGYGYRGGAYGNRCARTCFRNTWGRVECVQRCY